MMECSPSWSNTDAGCHCIGVMVHTEEPTADVITSQNGLRRPTNTAEPAAHNKMCRRQTVATDVWTHPNTAANTRAADILSTVALHRHAPSICVARLFEKIMLHSPSWSPISTKRKARSYALADLA